MANSKYEYVRMFEQPDILLPHTWIVVRIDGRGFHKFSKRYDFAKPNDKRALDLMNTAAVATMKEMPDLVIAYGISDEFRFVIISGDTARKHRIDALHQLRFSQKLHPVRKTCKVTSFHENAGSASPNKVSKLVTTIVSTFSSFYIYLWPIYFPDVFLKPPLPTFDGRAICYPSVQTLRDYMSWRQVDCHINNLYNTTFWSLVQKGGMTTTVAEKTLSGTVSGEKNEILYSKFGINYNNEPEMFRKGSILVQDYELGGTMPAQKAPDDETTDQKVLSKNAAEKERKARAKVGIAVEHCDLIKDEFWQLRPWILSGVAGKLKS